MNAGLLKQARKGIEETIKANPSTITVLRIAKIDNGFGTFVPNPSGTPVPYTVRCRVSHDGYGVPALNPSPVGFSASLNRFILVDSSQTIEEGDVFSILGKTYRIGVIDPLVQFGAIIGYQAPLTEARA